MKKNKLKIHFTYIVIILTAIVVFLLTHDFGGDTNLVQYLSFGLGLTSLVVGLIAIFQTSFSSENINSSISKLEQASKVIIENSQNLQSVVGQFNSNFGEVPLTLSKIQEKLDLQGPYKAIDTTKQTDQTHIPKELMNRFFSLSSLRGLLGIYAVVRSFEKNKSFTIEQFEATSDLSYVKYTQGFLIAVSSLGLFTFNLNSESFTILSVDPSLTKDTVEEAIIKIKSTYKDNENVSNLVDAMKSKIDSFFI